MSRKRRLVSDMHRVVPRAGNGTRTRDPNLGKVVLYQLSYSRSGTWIPGLSVSAPNSQHKRCSQFS